MGRWWSRLDVLRPAATLCLLLALGSMAAWSTVPAAAQTSQAPGCGGRNLVEVLRAEGRLEEVERRAREVVNGSGKFYRIERDGLEPSYLFGTIHLTDPRILALPGAVEDAFERASTLVIETTDVIDPVKAAAAFFANPDLINLPKGKTLDDYLDAPGRSAVREALDEKGIPFDTVKTLQPWFIAISLMMPACEMTRQAEGAVVLDADLARLATEAGKPVEGLETAKEQLDALASLNPEMQTESLVATARLGDRMPDIMETMLVLYQEGEIGMLMPAIEAAVPDGGMLVGAGEGYMDFEKRVITDRNVRMVERMEPYLDAGGGFVAVGALHLPGEEGLVELLRKDGWTVTRAD